MNSHITIRHFRNTDVLGIVRLWNNATRFAGLLRPIDAGLFGGILSKPYFELEKFLVAVDEDVPGGRIVGLIHGGYAPNAAMDDVDRTRPVIAMFMGEPREDREEIASGLLHRMEQIFLEQPVCGITAGAVYPNAPFYLGMLSGGDLYGFLESDPLIPYIFQKNGYYTQTRYHLFRISLANYRIFMTRFIMQMTRQYAIDEDTNPRCSNLWDAFARLPVELRRFRMIDKETKEECASVFTRRLERDNDYGWGTRIGLHDLHVREELRHQGLARFFTAKVLEILTREHASFVELQVNEKNVRAISAFENLNFEKFATGAVYYKEVN